MAEGLIDVVPRQVRFGVGDGQKTTRNMLVKNVSTSALPVEIQVPELPFRVVHGETGKELAQKAVQLDRGGTLPLRVVLDREALRTARDGAARAPVLASLLFRVDEVCRPLCVHLAAAPEDMPDEELRRLWRARGGVPPAPAAAAAAAAPEAHAAAGPAADAAASAPARAAAAAAGTEPPAALRAFLGEAPAPAALKGARSLASASPARSSRSPAFPRERDSPPSSPEPGGGFGPGGGLGDDDRPPTPTPFGFECAAMENPRATPPHGGPQAAPASGLAPAPPRPPPSVAAPRPAVEGAGRSPRRAPLQEPSPRAAARLAPLPAAPTAAASSAPAPLGPRSRGAPASTGGASADGLFLVDGVGWCDEYGAVVSGGKSGGRRSTSFGARGAASRPKAFDSAALAGRRRGGSVGPRRRPAATKADMDAAWDAVPGI